MHCMGVVIVIVVSAKDGEPTPTPTPTPNTSDWRTRAEKDIADGVCKNSTKDSCTDKLIWEDSVAVDSGKRLPSGLAIKNLGDLPYSVSSKNGVKPDNSTLTLQKAGICTFTVYRKITLQMCQELSKKDGFTDGPKQAVFCAARDKSQNQVDFKVKGSCNSTFGGPVTINIEKWTRCAPTKVTQNLVYMLYRRLRSMTCTCMCVFYDCSECLG